jgi:hypothetical protein
MILAGCFESVISLRNQLVLKRSRHASNGRRKAVLRGAASTQPAMHRK